MSFDTKVDAKVLPENARKTIPRRIKEKLSYDWVIKIFDISKVALHKYLHNTGNVERGRLYDPPVRNGD
ncbi:hypothetical protein [Infirmifilum sp.]|uniref:hypothetical protein n=1 Tax=Infirmifilum sp. TaxID=2856575 RepID=UPI003D0DD264